MKNINIIGLLLIVVFSLFIYGYRTVDREAALPAQTIDDNVTLYATGDIMVGRYIGKRMKSDGVNAPFEFIKGDLKKADIVFGNLESMIGVMKKDKKGVEEKSHYKKDYNFLAAPESAKALKDAGFTVVSIANNHSMDYGPKGITSTRKYLKEAGVSYFGAGKDLMEAREPVIIEKNGTKFAFLGYGVAHSNDVYAGAGRAGIAPFFRKYLKVDIKNAKLAADIVIVSIHWGVEYEAKPIKRQVKLAHDIIDYGADIILGHHPHVVQSLEFYKDKPIIYSMGNFLFDQKSGRTKGGMIYGFEFKGSELASIEAMPLGRVYTYYPKLAVGEVRTRQLKELKEISLYLNEDKAALDFLEINESTALLD